jgi:hypothetical protein
LAAGYGDTLAAQEEAVKAVTVHETFDAAAVALRPDVEMQGARRWLRRRVRRHALTLLLTSTALGVPTDSVVVFSLREAHPAIIRQLPTPVGLAHRPLAYWQPRSSRQHPMGPDPPSDGEVRHS